MPERNRELVETWYHRMWNQWDETVFPEILEEDITFRGSLGKVIHGFDGVSQYMDIVRTAFPDFANTIEETISEGNKVFARLTYRGTHEGEIFGIQPTGKAISYAGAAVFTIAEDRIADVWVLGDIHGLLQQLTMSE